MQFEGHNISKEGGRWPKSWAVLGELRYDIPTGIKQLTRSQLYAYVDHGQVYNIDPAAGTPSTQHGTSVGGGVRVAWEDNYSADVSRGRWFL